MPRRDVQLALRLPAVPRWGGSRPNAGRKRGDKVRHCSRGRFRRLPAHVTLRVRSDVPSLRTVPIVHEIERTFAAGCARPGFRLVHYSLQGNHAHLIVEADDRDALGRGMKAIAARLALAVNRVAHRHGPVFADRYHHQLLSTPRQVHRALRYVLLNSRKTFRTVASDPDLAHPPRPGIVGALVRGLEARVPLPHPRATIAADRATDRAPPMVASDRRLAPSRPARSRGSAGKTRRDVVDESRP